MSGDQRRQRAHVHHATENAHCGDGHGAYRADLCRGGCADYHAGARQRGTSDGLQHRLTGPRDADNVDGPEEFHLVIVDNGRSQVLGSEFRDVLRCIRCGACMNTCPAYRHIGGHGYGSIYPALSAR